MTHHEPVIDYMRRDPGRNYTAAEIADDLFPPPISATERNNQHGRVAHALKMAAKYGLVEKIGTGKNGCWIWRLTE